MKIFKKIVLIFVAVFLAFILLSSLLIVYTKGKIVQDYINHLVSLQNKSTVGVFDKIIIQSIYKGMLIYGNFKYPEAADILEEYLYGNADTLELDSKYFKSSDFIKSKTANITNKTIGPIYIKLLQDQRIAYAINGFYIDVKTDSLKRSFKLYQNIIFSNNINITTGFYIFGNKISIPDKLVYAVKTRKTENLFVYSKWNE